MCKEKEIKMIEMELDMDEKTVEAVLKHAKENIFNDKTALINWAVNDILKGMIEKEKENGESNS